LAFVCALEGCRAAKGIVTDEKNKPRLDEQTFEKLLEAAYVLQEHNREMRRGREPGVAQRSFGKRRKPRCDARKHARRKTARLPTATMR
jgi:ribosomal protein L4